MGFTRFQKLLPIVSNLTAFIAQFGFKTLSPMLEIIRLGAMTALNTVNLVQSVQQKNVLNTVWNSAFLGMDVFAGLGVVHQTVLRKTTLLRKEQSLLSKTTQLRKELSSAMYKPSEDMLGRMGSEKLPTQFNLLNPSQEGIIQRLPPPPLAKRLERYGDPSDLFHTREKENLERMQHLFRTQNSNLQKDFYNLSIIKEDKVVEYQSHILSKPALQRLPRLPTPADNESWKAWEGMSELLEERKNNISTLLQESRNSLNQLEKAQSNLHAIRNTRILNRANNLFTNVKDYAVLEIQNKEKPPSKTSTALQSVKALLGGL